MVKWYKNTGILKDCNKLRPTAVLAPRVGPNPIERIGLLPHSQDESVFYFCSYSYSFDFFSLSPLLSLYWQEMQTKIRILELKACCSTLHAVRHMWQLATHSNHPIRGKQYCKQVAIKLKYDKISFHYEVLSCVIRFSFITTFCTLYDSIKSKREGGRYR